MTAVAERSPVLIEVHPTSTPAADLPLGMVHDVLEVLRAHGLDPAALEVSTALYRVVSATPAEHGGTASSDLVAEEARR